MNRIYRLCWNRSLSQWVAASELASCKRSGASRSAVVGHRMMMFSLLSASLGMTGLAHAGNTPTGGQVVAGSGQISQSGNTTTIQQNSRLLSLNWQSFDVGADQTVNFLQPGASSIAVNRILGNTSSEIFGHLNANGQVWLINPNGVLFGQNAQVNVGGIVASTLDLDASTLGSDSVRFSGNGKGKVTNQGSITAANGGYVALIGNQVSNQGVIRAQLGTVALGGGSAVTLTFSDNHLLHLEVNESTLNNLAENRQLIVADGGQVLMTAGARDSLLASAVNNTGTVQARSVQDHDGVITLLGGMEAGTVNVGGTLDASAPNGGNGGQIETSAAHFALAGDARITASAASGKAGTWLIDPDNLTIDQPTATTIATTLQGGTSVTEHTTSTTSTGLGTVTTGGLGDITLLAGADITWTNAASTLTFDSFHDISVNAKINGTGGVNMNATGGTLTIGNAGGISAGTGATVNASKFVNNAGANALGAKWLAYTASPLTNTLGGLTPNYIQYNASIGSTLLGTGNGLIYSLAPTLSITGLTGTVTKVYDNTNAANGFTGANFNTNGLVNGDTIGAATGGSYATVNVGSGITVTSPGTIGNFTLFNGLIPVFGYSLGAGTVTGNIGQITPAQLTAQIIGNPTKVYDGTTTATLGSSNYEIDGFFGGQGATVKQPSSIAYAGSNAGSEALNATFSVTNFVANAGTNLANYMLPTVATGMGTISKAPLLISGLLGINKIYDGGTGDMIDVSGATLFGVIQPDIDDVHLDTSGITGMFAQSNVGNGLGVSVTGYQLTGNKEANYTVVAPAGVFANITAKQLTIDQVSANDKTYDNTLLATLNTSSATLDGIVGTDDVTLSTAGASAKFGQTDVGSNLAVTTMGFTLGGAAQSNYVLAQPSLFANITPALLTISMMGNPTKTYDGTAAVTLGSGNFNISGFIGGQGGTVAQSSATYATANAGNNINVTATLQPSDFAPNSGTSMSNYTFATSVLGLGTINPFQLTGQIVNNPTKVFDRNTDAFLTGSNFNLVGLLPGQSITVNTNGTAPGTYNDFNAGARGVTSVALPIGDFVAGSGTTLSNYIMPSTYSGSGTITPAPLTGGFVITAGIVNASKIYDGLLSITLHPGNFTLSGWVGSDSATVTGDITGNFGQKDVGTNLALSAILATSDLTPGGGTNLANYQINTPVVGIGNITPAALTVSIVNNPTKIYNGSTDVALASGNFNITGWVNGENGSINPSATAGYDSPNASTIGGRTITATLTPGNYVLNAGTLLSNYTVDLAATGPGTIKQAPLFVTGVFATNKTYNANNVDALNVAAVGLAGLVDTDTNNVALSLAGVSATFSQQNVGNGLAVTATGFQITGGAAANYLLQPVTGLLANITKASLTLSGVTANDKIYDGNNSDTLTIAGNAALSGIFGGDTVGFDATGATATFSTSNAGTGLRVTTDNFLLNGGSAGNYQLVQPGGLTATINPKQLTAVITGSPTKVYDGTKSATLTAGDYELDGFVGTDNATIPQSATANYVTKDVGNGLGVASTLVTSDFLATGGTNLANYILPTTGAGSNGIIQPKVIDLTGTRVYDGTTTGAGSLFGQLAGVNGETVTATGSGTLVSRNVGNEWAFTSLGNIALANGTNGGLGSNYTLVGGTDWVTITPRALTATFTAEDKTYDGNTAAILQGAALEAATGNAGLVAGDDVSLINPTAGLFNNKNAGTGKAVSGNMSIGGDDAGNYTFTQGTATANIDQLHISVTATGTNKQYDGLTHDNVVLAGDHVVAGDTVNFSSTAADFVDANVANGKTVNVAGITASGADAGNYILDNAATSTTANILPRIINLSGTRIYDGTPTAGAVSFNGGAVQGQNGEMLSLTGNFTLSSKNVGNYSWMDGGSLALGNGTGLASNYTLVGGTDTYTVTPRALTASFDADNKVYDGTTVAVLENALLQSAAGNQGLIAGDKVTLTNGTVGSFDNKNAGAGKTVTGNLGITGDDATNYTFTNSTSTADIGKASLTVIATGTDKTYDGNINDIVTLKGGVAGDNLTFNSTSATFGDKDVGVGKTVTVDGITVGGSDAVNYDLASTTAQATADINKVILNLTGTRIYNGTAGATAGLFGNNGVLTGVNGETLTLTGTGIVSDKNVGLQKGFANGGLDGFGLSGNGAALAGNYTLVGGTDWLTITQKALTATTAVNGRAYDGTANIALIGATLSGLVANDDVVLGNDATGTFADKNVANAKAVTTAMTISGGDMGNYAFTQPTGLTADVTPLMINVVASAQNKVYDTTTNVTINSLTSNGLLGSDVVNFAFGSAAFDDANAANGKTVTVNGITKSGTDAGNYTINTTAQTNADITRVVLDLSGTRVYDGSTGADASLFGSSGVLAGIGGQTLNLSGSGVAASKNVVTSALFAGLGTLALADGGNGGLANNYTLLGGSDTLTITQKALTATTTVNGRAYDGTANIALIGAALSGLVANDDVVLGNDATGTFADKNVANAKAVTTAMTISGGDMGNYAFTQPTGLAADVTPLMITVGATTFDKIYDTNSDATSLTTLNHSGILGGDMVNVAFGSAAFDDANAGNHKTVTVNGITKSGTDAGNYLISATTTTTANITPVLLNLTGTRVYDGGTSADALLFGNNGVLAGIGGQTLNLSGSGVAGSKNVGNNVAFAGLGTLALADGGNGGLAGNYTLVGGGDTLTITPKAITVGATGDDKTYDATTAATVHYTNNGVVGGDDIGFTGTANFAGVNAGNGIGINVSGIAATGADALNYSFNNTAATSASITPVVLDLSGTRVYDGGTGADAALFGANGVLTGINGETVNLAGSGVLNNKNVGNGKPFAGFGSLALGDGGNGGLAGNYTLVGGVDSVTVTPKTITVGATGSDKTYDGNTNAGVTLNGNGVIVGDQVSFTPGSANYAGPNAGTGIAITANGITDSGADAGNYAFNTTASTSGTITPAILDLTGTRTYDGTAGAAASLFGNNGVLTGVNGETLTLTGTGAVSDKNVGSQKGFANGGLNGFGLSGNGAALAGNYTLAGGTDWLSITPAMLAVIGTTATDRAYDGTKIDALSGSMLSGLFGNDDVTLGNTATGLFDTKNVGNDKSVTTAMTIAGGDVGNYILVQPVGLTANVTPRPVTVNATGTDKYFDGNTTDQVTLGSDGVLAGDQLSFTNQAANFSDSAVGNGKTVTVTGIQGNGADAGNYVIADPTTTTTADIMGGQASSFGIDNASIAQLQGVVGPSAIDTPYGVADPGTVGSFTGNQKKQHRPLERNRARTDFKSGLALSVVDGGVQMPANEMP